MGLDADILEANLERDYDAHTQALFYRPIRKYAFEQSLKRYQDSVNLLWSSSTRDRNEVSSYVSSGQEQKKRQSYAHEKVQNRKIALEIVQAELEEHRQQLMYEASLVYTARIRSIVRIRAILRIQNTRSYSSRIINEALQFLKQSAEEMQSLSDKLLEKLDKEMLAIVSEQTDHIDDAVEQKMLIEAVLTQAYRYISDTNHDISHPDFRLIESDCVRLIRMIEEHPESEQRAVIFSTYLKRKHQVRKSDIVCQSCHHAMFSGISNCLFCYERR